MCVCLLNWIHYLTENEGLLKMLKQNINLKSIYKHDLEVYFGACAKKETVIKNHVC